MKNLRTSLLCACITLYSLSAFAQETKVPINEPDYNKPKMFQNLPDNISVSVAQLNSLLGNPVGRGVNINLSDKSQFQFEGEVVSVVSKFENTVQSVVVRSTNYSGAMLTISRISNTDGTTSYAGRLMSFQHGDLYELQSKDGDLVLVKKRFYDLVNE